MLISLKNIQYEEFSGKKTPSYSASLYIGKTRIGTVSNTGRMRRDAFAPDGERNIRKSNLSLYDDACAYLAKRSGNPLHRDQPALAMSAHCAELVTQAAISRDLKRLMKRRILYLNEDGIHEANKTKPTPENIAHFRRHNPECTVLNGLSLDRATRLYREKQS